MGFLISQFTTDSAWIYTLDLIEAKFDNWIAISLTIVIRLFMIEIHWLGTVFITLIYGFVCFIKFEEIKQKQKKPSRKEILSALNRVSSNEIEKQKNSGKYLENLFIEIGNSKDLIRYKTDTLNMMPRIGFEITSYDFEYLNKALKKDQYDQINPSYKKLKKHFKKLKHKNYKNKISKILSHLKDLKRKISECGLFNYKYSSFEYTIKHYIDLIEGIDKKVIIINEGAGQGKTNFICDIVDNYYLKKELPVLFTSAKKLSAQSISQSVLKLMFGEAEGLSFKYCLEVLERYCIKKNCFFVIAIDGINEHNTPQKFSNELELFIEELEKYDFIKVLITCRTEYYKYNFENLDESSFKNNIEKITKLTTVNKERLKEKLFNKYLKEFDIRIKNYSEYVFNILVENFLLLRIFCEVNKGKDIEKLSDVYKSQLFDEYLNSNISEYLSKQEGDVYGVKGNFKAKEFLGNVVKRMLELEKYSNIPIDNVIQDEDLIPVYQSFLDSNLLIKRDLQFSDINTIEVVNFTFDEFRDFIISKYLVEVIFNEDPNQFRDILEKQITNESQIIEGCSKFLFLNSKKNDNENLYTIISDQEWYVDSVIYNVFELADETIREVEVKLIKDNYTKSCRHSTNILINCVRRRDTKKFKKLNINTLIEILCELNEDELVKYLYMLFDEGGYINRESLIKFHQDILNDQKLMDDELIHNSFKVLIFFLGCKGSLQLMIFKDECTSLFESYWYRYRDKAEELLNEIEKCSNDYMRSVISEFRSVYGDRN